MTSRPRNRSVVWAAALTCAAAFSGACQAPPAAPPQAPPAVTVTTPDVRDVVPVQIFPGSTEAVASVDLSARVQGFLEEIHFSPSQFVNEGQILFIIEQEPFIARRDRAEANLKSSQAALRRAESDLERMELAVKTNAVSQQEVTRARAERDQTDAALQAAGAELESARIELGYTTIKAPVSGLISRNLVDVGNLVGPSGPSLLASIRKVNPIHAYFEVSERQFARILESRGGHDGMETDEKKTPVTLMLEETGLTVEGVIDSVDNTVDASTGTIMLRGLFDNPEALLFPGFYVKLKLEGTVLRDAFVVQEKALGTDLGGKFLYIVGDDNIVEQRYVELGQSQNDGMIPVLEGLQGGERYIIKGLLRARPGMPVTPELEAQAGA